MAVLEIKPTSGMKLRVAAVMLAATVTLGVLVWLLSGGGAAVFARKASLKTYLPDATGLSDGAAVRIDGIQVGTIRRISISGYLDLQRSVRVDMRVDAAYLPKIPADSLTSITSNTMIGDKFLDIAPGKNPLTVADGGELPSEPEETAADKAHLIQGLQNSLHKVDSMVTELASPDTPIGHYIVGEAEYDQMIHSVEVFEHDMHVMVASRNPAEDVVFTTTLYAKIQKPVRDIDDALQAIQRGEGVAGHLYTSDDQYNQILASMKDLRKSIADMRATMEKSGESLRDEETYRKVRRMLASTDATLAALNRGEGGTGELLNSPRFYESLVGSLKSIQDMLRDFDANPKKYTRVKLF